ncbi:MAG: hypothetical protein RMJ66_04240 [Bacteroidia bacterium]|nr:hypothetical protein [Bacteroidia bacterium]MDW8134257.1 hypothetical protein [Bacteroidia bacterium]
MRQKQSTQLHNPTQLSPHAIYRASSEELCLLGLPNQSQVRLHSSLGVLIYADVAHS